MKLTLKRNREQRRSSLRLMFRVITLNVRCLNPKKLDWISEFFSDKLGETLVSVFNHSLACGDLLNSMKASVTRLVHKKDDKRDLKNWRPISLLNVDYKICSKAISLRLAKVLGSVIDPDQTCSVPGRSIFSSLGF